MEEREFWLKVGSAIASALYAYHKFLSTQLSKKVNKDDCNSTHQYIKDCLLYTSLYK